MVLCTNHSNDSGVCRSGTPLQVESCPSCDLRVAIYLVSVLSRALQGHDLITRRHKGINAMSTYSEQVEIKLVSNTRVATACLYGAIGLAIGKLHNRNWRMAIDIRGSII